MQELKKIINHKCDYPKCKEIPFMILGIDKENKEYHFCVNHSDKLKELISNNAILEEYKKKINEYKDKSTEELANILHDFIK